jgi:uncharacterized protein (TIGR02271 family)
LTALPPVDRGPGRDAGAPLELPVMGEGLDVHKRRVLTEELYVRTQRVEAHHPQQVTLRREEARVERLNSLE